MRKNIVHFILFFFLALTLSCKKENNKASPKILREYVGITVKTTDTLQSNLYALGHREGINITSQAKHYQVSKIEKELTSGQYIYKYRPISNYNGEDSSVLESINTDENWHLITTFRITVK